MDYSSPDETKDCQIDCKIDLQSKAKLGVKSEGVIDGENDDEACNEVMYRG